MNSVLIKNLYKEKLKIACQFGYKIGSQSNELVSPGGRVKMRKIVRLYEKNKLGGFLAENIKYQYKMAKHEHDEIFVEKLIDNGFSALKTLNMIKHSIREEYE